MCPEYIRELVNSVSEAPPMLFVGESTHVVENTHGLLFGQRHVLRQENDRFISMSLDERVGVVLPRLLVIDGGLLGADILVI